jgi:hypothetical protein
VYLTTASYVYASPDSWTWNIPVALTNSQTYLVQTQATDRAGNVRVQQLGSFTFDNQNPTAGVSTPANGVFYPSLPTISGTAADNVALSTTQISVQDLGVAGPNDCYDPVANAFNAACPGWFYPQGNASGGNASGNWSFSGVPFVNAHQYVMLARATDMATNAPSSFSVGVSSINFFFDTDRPSVSIALPAVVRSTSVSMQQGTASTPAPGILDLIQLRVHGGTPDQYWDPT